MFRCDEGSGTVPAGGKVKLGAYNRLRRRLKMKQSTAYRFQFIAIATCELCVYGASGAAIPGSAILREVPKIHGWKPIAVLSSASAASPLPLPLPAGSCPRLRAGVAWGGKLIASPTRSVGLVAWRLSPSQRTGITIIPYHTLYSLHRVIWSGNMTSAHSRLRCAGRFPWRPVRCRPVRCCFFPANR